MIRTIVVDDEAVIAEEMGELLRPHEAYEVVGIYTEPLEALEGAKEGLTDCALLDIAMMGMSGIELAEKLVAINPNMEIVFTTAYNHYAAQAFEVNAIDYLLKPVSPERLQKSVEKMAKRRALNVTTQDSTCEIRCLGGFEVVVGGTRIKWGRAKTRELFAYLVQYRGRGLFKYTLCEQLWPAYYPEQALAYLQTSIWAIRKTFKELGYSGIRIEYSDHRYFLHMQGVYCDTEEFEKHYGALMKDGDKAAGRQAADCYQGPYMDGEDWLWAYPDRGNYERMYREVAGYGR